MQEQLFKEFFLKSSMAISYYKAILDAEGHFKEAELIDANKAFEKIVGQNSGSLQGKYFADLFPGVDTELHKWEKAVSDALKKGTLIKHDISYHLEKKSLLITIIPLSDLYFCCIFHDVTNTANDLKKIEELERFFDVTPDLLAITDHDANLIKLNRAWSTVLGYTKEELNSHRFLDFIHPDDLNRTLTTLQNLASQKRVSGFVNRFRCSNGSFRTIEWYAAPFGEFSYASGRDVTQRIEQEDVLRKNLELKEKHLELMVLRQQNIHEFLENAFRLIKMFTHSEEAFIFQYEEELDQYKLYAWSVDNQKNGERTKKQERRIGVRERELWDEAVTQKKPIMVNAYAPMRTPEEQARHLASDVQIRNFISIPVFNGNRVVSVVGVANKRSDYINEDLLNLSLITNTVWGAVERIHSDLLLKKERELFRATIFSINEGIVVTDKQGRITLMNKKAEDLICWSSAEAEGLPFRDVFLNVDQRTRERLPSPVKCVMKNGQNAESAEDEILIPREGEELIISWRAAGMRDEAGQITGVVISFRDISKEYHQKKEIEGFLNMNLDMLCVTDREGTFLRVNKKFQEILGYSQKKIEEKKWITLVHFEDVKSTNEAINQAINTEDQACFINRCRCKDGIYKYIEWNLEKNGNHLYASARDITEKSIREEELRNMAAFDELTGIYNRHFIDERIDEILERSNSYQEPISMVLFDLDNFKKVNDTFGHPVGDKVLKELADIVSGILRKTDFFVRFGGEEFVILMPGTTAKGAMTVSEKIRFTLEHNRNPIVGSYTASFGVSERKIGEPFDAWYQHADEALYFAKKTGKNRVVNAETLKEIGIPLSLLEWNADWESGNEAIDKDHKEMIDYANTFINSVLSKETLQITLRECDVLLEHLARHFEREEAFLEEIKFPAAEKHKSLHESLLRTAFGIKHAYLKGAVDASALFTFVLEDLIRDHLSKEDVLYYSYIKEGEKRKK